jgi:hypothetical protein
MEQVTAHYAERIQHNHNQVTQEKDALHNWQIQKQYENQRISEVIELCAKPAPSAPMANAAAASSGAPAGTPASSAPALPNRNPEVRYESEAAPPKEKRQTGRVSGLPHSCLSDNLFNLRGLTREP